MHRLATVHGHDNQQPTTNQPTTNDVTTQAHTAYLNKRLFY